MAAKTVNGWSRAVTKPEQITKQLRYHEWLGEESDIVQLTPLPWGPYVPDSSDCGSPLGNVQAPSHNTAWESIQIPVPRLCSTYSATYEW
jgi:hypothetical protein